MGPVQPAGNYYDKYGSRNPIVRWIMEGFLAAFDRLIASSGANDVIEVGCGEGELSARMARRGMRVRACDVSPEIVEVARTRAARESLPIEFRQASIYDLSPRADTAQLVVCCEVLEHLPDSEQALNVLASLATPYLIASVPREPLWRILNICRGEYLSDLGNTPGHIQHWSRPGFVSLLARRFEVLEVVTPSPWTMVLCRVKT